MKKLWLLIILLSPLLFQSLKAQDTLMYMRDLPAPEEVKPSENATPMALKKKHSPKKATLLALFPGAGQFYNKKYWKIPIVYAGFGITTYYAITNREDYKLYKAAYDYKMGYITDASERVKAEAAKYTADNLITLRDYYRSRMELCWILTAAWYVVQIIDANVDAHFFYYEISDDLTLQVEPQWEFITNNLYGYENNVGVKLKFNF